MHTFTRWESSYSTKRRKSPLRTAESLATLFEAFGPRVVDQAMTDYSMLSRSPTPYCEVLARNAEELSALVSHSKSLDVSLRIRGEGHSLNGSSLPRLGELVVRGDALRHIRFDESGSVTAGGGGVVWDIDRIVAERGFSLPVINDGFPGPSIGGYVAAGGFGASSRVAGGLWESVKRLVVVDGLSRIHELTPADAVFPWIFGSMGQLGYIVEVTLMLNESDAPYPLGTTVSSTAAVSTDNAPHTQAMREEPGLVWFTLFTSVAEAKAAGEALMRLEKRYERHAAFRPQYSYLIRHHAVVAPLIYPRCEDFIATGTWGLWAGSPNQYGGRVRAFESDLTKIALIHKWRRYLQTEYVSSISRFREVLGAAYQDFRILKRQLDPNGTWNPGSVIPA